MRIINPATLEEVSEHPAIRLGEEYTVLEIFLSTNGRVELRTVSRADGTPCLWDAKMFVTVDERLPANWVVRIEATGVIGFAPAAWLEAGFWERYFNGEPDAVAAFEVEKDRVTLAP